jgi:DNA excision repair protein ERCC-2
MEFFFACLHFQRVGESIADDYQILMRRREGRHDYVIELNCLDPARLLAERHDCSRSTTCFSATVSPLGWMAAELGLGESCVGASLDSPFEPTQLSVTVDDTIDTRYRARESSLEMLRRKLVRWVSVDERNTVVYFPSYQYMTRFLDFCGEDFSARTVWVQRREQDEQERQALIDLLRAEDGVLGFCILGGVFSEGIDLPGRSLSRVAVVGVGTPQLNADNQALREYYERTGRPGFDFTYLYPGMQKVCQALGRVIRSEADTGEVLLLDSRYRQKQYRDLLPEHWHTRMTGDGQPQEG